jgi:hypothetical protein
MKGEYTPEYHQLRMAILERDGFRCQWPDCRSRRNLQVHHIIARSDGGSDDEDNLISMCRTHHRRLHRWQDRLRRLASGPAPIVAIFGNSEDAGSRACSSSSGQGAGLELTGEFPQSDEWKKNGRRTEWPVEAIEPP